MLVKLTGPRLGYNGRLGGINWVDGKARVAELSQKLSRGYGVVKDKSVEINFTVNSNDSKGFEEKLKERSGDIKQIIQDNKAEPEDKVTILETPIDPDEVFSKEEQDNGASELAKVVTNKKAEIESKKATNEAKPAKEEGVQFKPAPEGMKKSDVKSFDDFKGKGSWGTYKKYVIDLTGTSPRNKQQCVEVLEAFKATLSD